MGQVERNEPTCAHSDKLCYGYALRSPQSLPIPQIFTVLMHYTNDAGKPAGLPTRPRRGFSILGHFLARLASPCHLRFLP